MVETGAGFLISVASDRNSAGAHSQKRFCILASAAWLWRAPQPGLLFPNCIIN
jgi:hypothetical protein